MQEPRRTPRVLVVDDEERGRDAAKVRATSAGFREEEISVAESVSEALQLLKSSGGVDVWIVDLKLNGDHRGGYKFVSEALKAGNGVDPGLIILLTATISPDMADFLRSVAKADLHVYEKSESESDKVKLCGILRQWRDAFVARGNSTVIASEADRDLYGRLLPLIANNPAPILITGPTGCGKEHVAEALVSEFQKLGTAYRVSGTINCAGFSPKLITSQLFGHQLGSYSGAVAHELGYVLAASGYEMADGRAVDFKSGLKNHSTFKDEEPPWGEHHWDGTGMIPGILVLDEFDMLPFDAQATLLRAIENRPLKPLGWYGKGFKPNIQVIAMTSRWDRLQDASIFIPDLVARLSGWPIHIEGLEHKSREETARAIIQRRLLEQKTWEKNRVSGGKWISWPMTANEDAIVEMLSYLRAKAGGARTLQWIVNRSCAIARLQERGAPYDRKVLKADALEAVQFGEVSGKLIDRELRIRAVNGATSDGDQAWCESIESNVRQWLEQFVTLSDANYSKADVAAALNEFHHRMAKQDPSAIAADVELRKWHSKAKDPNESLLLAFCRALRIDPKSDRKAQLAAYQNLIHNSKTKGNK